MVRRARPVGCCICHAVVPGTLHRAAHLAKGARVGECARTIAVACKVEAQAANAFRCQCSSNLREPNSVPQRHKAMNKKHNVLRCRDAVFVKALSKTRELALNKLIQALGEAATPSLQRPSASRKAPRLAGS